MEVEIAKLKLQMDPRLEKMIQEVTDLESIKELLKKKDDEFVTPKKESQLSFLMKSKSSKRALATVIIILSLTIMMGSVALQVFAGRLFKEAMPNVSSNQCSIWLGIDFLIASLVCVLVVDRCGRKNLLIFSSAVSGVCTLLLGIQLQFKLGSHWFTGFLIYAYSFVYNTGCAVTPFVITAEVFLPEVASLGNGITLCALWVMNFITLFIFHPLIKAIGIGPVFYIFSSMCFLGALYTKIYLPETKGMSADAIQTLFLKPKKEMIKG